MSQNFRLGYWLIWIFVLGKGKKAEKNNEPGKKPEEQAENNKNALAVDKMNANKGEMRIDPSIFVSLKKGSISTTYKIGEVLGEGNIFFFFETEITE